MATIESSHTLIETLADLLDRLGGISPSRVRFVPAPGTATEDDLIKFDRREQQLCELVDGVLVEKAMGFREACLAGALLALLRDFVIPRNLGLVSGADGMVRLFPGLVRIPDVAFVSWNRIPGRTMPTTPAPDLAPDLVVEVLSAGNTDKEMARKRLEYFRAGVSAVWLVDPVARTLGVYFSPEQQTLYADSETLDAGPFLPGLTVSLPGLFAELDRKAPES